MSLGLQLFIFFDESDGKIALARFRVELVRGVVCALQICGVPLSRKPPTESQDSAHDCPNSYLVKKLSSVSH